MAHYVTNRGLLTLLNTATGTSVDLRAGVLVGATPTKAQVKTCNTVADLLALGGGITESTHTAAGNRADLTVQAPTESDAGSGSATWTATAPVYTTPAAGQTWLAQFYFIHTGSDSTATLISVDVPSSSVATNGANITGPAFSLTISDPTA